MTKVRAPSVAPRPDPTAAFFLLGVAIAATFPAVFMRVLGFHPAEAPLMGMVVFGGGIVAAAFVLTWAAEIAEIDIGSGLAVVFLALVTVLPEYAVDLYFSWRGATDPAHQAYATANMTGANRLLSGAGWPTIALIVWYRTSLRSVDLDRDRSGDVVWLGAATLYSLVIPLKGSLAWYDALVLFGIYAAYVVSARNQPDGHPDLVGPPQAMARWPQRKRRIATALLFLWSAAAIGASAEPFAESLVSGGLRLGIDEFLLVQWLAPLASEAPEFVVVVLLTLRGRAGMGFGALVSSTLNQWTLLIGGIPLAFGLSSLVHHGSFAPSMPIDDRQVEELWLTAAQGLYATATIVDLRFGLGQALTVLGMFTVQFVGTVLLASFGHKELVAPLHVGLSILYGILALERIVTQRADVRRRLAAVFGKKAR